MVVRRGSFHGLNVAIKSLHEVIVSDHNQGLFLREISMMSALAHPNIILCIGAIMEAPLRIVMELMHTSVRQQYETEPSTMTIQCVLSISMDIALALRYLHEQTPYAVIHADVSSASILLNPAPHNTWIAKLGGLGMANYAHKMDTSYPGSSVYAAPEAESPKLQTTKMDVYSYGVLLLEMLTHRFPNPEHRSSMLRCIPRHLSFVALIESCLRHDRNRRPNMETVTRSLSGMQNELIHYSLDY